MDDFLKDLNEQQEAAVTYNDGPQLVIAGAGSGKTRVLTYKILYLLQNGFTPSRIMALTFTNKAARTMRERILGLTSPEVASRLWMGTFHSIFARILLYNAERIGFRNDYTIYDANDSKTLIKQIIKDMQLDDKVYKPSTIQNIISNAKNALLLPDDYERDAAIMQADKIAKRPHTSKVYRAYCARCKVAGAMDFDDILLHMNILLRDNPDIRQRYQDYFQYILVDEYQDTNFAQHMIILQLTKEKGNLFVVGDDAQSIYSFRGANIDNILRLKEVYPKIRTFKLEQNYRSTKSIIDAANSLIDKNRNQIKKHSFTDNPVGNKIGVIQCYSDFEESYVVANQIVSIKSLKGDSLDDFAILYRTNAQSRVLEEALRKRNIPYRIYGGLSFYQRKEVKDAICYLRITVNPDDDEALRRIINIPARGIGDTTINKIQHCAIENSVSMWTVICNPQNYALNVNSGTLKKLTSFAELITSFIDQNAAGSDAYVMTRDIILRSGLYDLTNCDNTPENISKRENLEEIINYAKSHIDEALEQGITDNGLTSFLSVVSLATDQDQEDENDPSSASKVTLMTAHAAKGLEYKNIIITGVEEDLFPAQMSKDSPAQIEEERRLLYVAITRAMRTCTITFATTRYHNGQQKPCSPSRFIRDIDPSLLALSQTSSSAGSNYNPLATKNKFGNKARNTAGFIRPSEPTPKPEPKPSTPIREVPSNKFVPLNDVLPKAAATASSQSHSVDQLSTGMKIHHIRFGKGVITKIDTSGSEPKIMVEFAGNDVRTLLLKFAKFDIL